MSYITWRKDNEKRYRDIADDGALETFPAFKESATNDLSDTVIGPVVEQLVNNPEMTMIHFACVFSEYLFEEYGVNPVDIEIFTQYIIKAVFKHTEKTTGQAVTAIIDQLKNNDQINPDG